MTILGVIPARGGSKRIPGKNLRRLEGKTLVEWAIRSALDSKKLTQFVISTDNLSIRAEAQRFGVPVIHRSAELALDTTPMVEVFQHVVAVFEADYYVCLQPTTPFR